MTTIDHPPITIYVIAQRWAEDRDALPGPEIEVLLGWIREAMDIWDRANVRGLSLAGEIGRVFFCCALAEHLELSPFEADDLAELAEWPAERAA